MQKLLFVAALLGGSWAAAAAPATPKANSADATGPTALVDGPKSDTPERDQGLSFGANQINGQVQAFEPMQKKITIDQSGKKQELKLTDDTTVFVDGRLGSVMDLKEGQEVRAAFENRDGGKSLRWIEVTPKTNAKVSATDKPFFGHIASIDREAKKVTITHGDDQKVLEITGSTKILGMGKQAKFDDLKEGQEVRASLGSRDAAKEKVETYPATDLEILSSPTPDKAAAPPAEKPPKAQSPDTAY
jgi:Cu/Ag efflux protein CusF